MPIPRALRVFIPLIVVAISLAGCQGVRQGPPESVAGPSPSPTPAPSGSFQSNINHIVFMMQENRSFDSYFGQLNAFRISQGLGPDVDGVPANASNPTFDGSGTIKAFKMATQCQENTSPSWNESHRDRNRNNPGTPSAPATMDGFVYTAAKYARDNNFFDQEGRRAMGHYDSDQLNYYYFMATAFATSDRWFSPLPARTPPNRIFSLAATSAGYTNDPPRTLPIKTIFHLLQNANISWKVYVTDPGITTLNVFQPFATQHKENIVPLSQYFADLAAGTLPQVALIETGETSGLDEHPGNAITPGVKHTANIINALMTSSAWKDSVFILTWDEGGGLFDHVPPMDTVSPDGIKPLDLKPTDHQGDFTITGFRVPLIVISPFVKPHFVSHTPMDYSAVLKFIETRFGLPNLTARDAAQPDMTEFFDFSNAALATPPTPPTPTSGRPCYFDHLP
ncbi:MAG TPA: alkaline phosphatase family protein [Terriglobales bacterium]|nr:alkaline phosphatase family protein [Terriglobales bacterium]